MVPVPRLRRGLLPLLFGHAGEILPAQAQVEGQVGSNLPVVLYKDGRNILPVIFSRHGGSTGQRVGARDGFCRGRIVEEVPVVVEVEVLARRPGCGVELSEARVLAAKLQIVALVNLRQTRPWR